MKFCRENASDIKKYFLGSFMKFPSLAGDQVHCIDVVHNEEVKGKTISQDGETVPFVFHLYAEEQAPAPDIDFILPRKGFFNTKDGCYFLYRVPARQYRRGVCMDNTCIEVLSSNGSFMQVGLSLELLSAYVGKQEFKKFHETSSSYAISRRMAVSGTTVFVDHEKIATVYHEEGIIRVNKTIFIPELEKIVKEMKQSYKVVPMTPKGAQPKKLSSKYSMVDGEIYPNEE